jgi:chaperonin GroEL
VNLFISYRRGDTAGHAGWLHERLKAHFGGEHVFMDIDSVRPGVNFKRVVEEAITKCDAVLVLIGREWVSASDAQGRRRLDLAQDLVRLEVASALQRDIPVIPVLVGGATMPTEEELPEVLQELVWRNAVELSDARWEYDTSRLIKGLVGSTETSPVDHLGSARKPEVDQRTKSTAPEDSREPALQPERPQPVADFMKLADAIRLTIGPKTRRAVIDGGASGQIVADNRIDIIDAYARADTPNTAVSLLNDLGIPGLHPGAGGIATGIVLARRIILDAWPAVLQGHNPLVVARGVEKGLARVVDAVPSAARTVENDEQILQVANTAGRDIEAAKAIGYMMAKVGRDGVITVEESPRINLEMEFVDGIEIDQGYISPDFVTDVGRGEAVLDGPYVFISDSELSAIPHILPALEKVVNVSKTVLIIGADVEGEALATLVVNKQHGSLNVVAIKAPNSGDRRKAMLEDIAILTGGTVITEKAGLRLDSVTVEMMGQARRVTSTKDTTTIIEGTGSQEAISARMQQIRAQIEDTTSDFDRGKLQERLAKLINGIAVVKVGGANEADRMKRRRRVEAALSASRAAIETGMVAGGGSAFLKARSAIDRLNLTGDEKIGADIVRRSLEEPLRQIAENAGYDGHEIVGEVERRAGNVGFETEVGQYGDMFQAGVVDPVSTACTALQYASALASALLRMQSVH